MFSCVRQDPCLSRAGEFWRIYCAIVMGWECSFAFPFRSGRFPCQMCVALSATLLSTSPSVFALGLALSLVLQKSDDFIAGTNHVW